MLTTRGNFLTRLNPSLLESLIGFLGFLVLKLWQNNQNLGTKYFWLIFPKFSFFRHN